MFRGMGDESERSGSEGDKDGCAEEGGWRLKKVAETEETW